VSGCAHCGGELSPNPYRGRRRKWCSIRCRDAGRPSVARVHRIDCRGCGVALPEQLGRRGSPLYLHDECRLVRLAWEKLLRNTRQRRLYSELRQTGAGRELALFGSSGDGRFEAAKSVLGEDSE
jgi:hypothetical protein